MATQTDRARGLVGNLASKVVEFATTANITLSGVQTIDGASRAAETSGLVKNQTVASENGVYIVQSGTWVRSPVFDGALDVTTGTLVTVATGTVNAQTLWMLTTVAPVIGTSNLTFVPFITPVTQSPTWAATMIPDFSLGQMLVRTLLGNTTFSAPTGLRAGEAYTMVLIQDATGSRTGTWNAAYTFPAGTDPVLSTAAGSVDVISFISYNGTTLCGVSSKAFA